MGIILFWAEQPVIGFRQSFDDGLFRLAELFAEDLEVWEKLLTIAPKNDPRYFAVRARVNRLRQAYQI